MRGTAGKVARALDRLTQWLEHGARELRRRGAPAGAARGDGGNCERGHAEMAVRMAPRNRHFPPRRGERRQRVLLPLIGWPFSRRLTLAPSPRWHEGSTASTCCANRTRSAPVTEWR